MENEYELIGYDAIVDHVVTMLYVTHRSHSTFDTIVDFVIAQSGYVDNQHQRDHITIELRDYGVYAEAMQIVMDANA